MSSEFDAPASFNDHSKIQEHLSWLKKAMPEPFFKHVSSTWQQVIANQMILLKAHEGLDHLMSKNEACIMTTRQNFDDLEVFQIFEKYFIESFERFSSNVHFEDEGPLVIIFLKLTPSCPQKELFEPEEITSLSASMKQIHLNFITLSPHLCGQKLFKLVKSLNSQISRFSCQITEFQDGFYIQTVVELERPIDETRFQNAKLYLTTTLNFERLEKLFPIEQLLIIDSMGIMCHQILSQIHLDQFSLKNIEDTFIKYVDLLKSLTIEFITCHNPASQVHQFETTEILEKIKHLDSGNPQDDEKRKQILTLFVTLLKKTEKTNYFVKDKKALSFRLNPDFITSIKELSEKFPESPFGLFFIKGEGFFGFHIRFKDLSRGGLRTVLSRTQEQAALDVLNIFSECYGLSFTQQKKNKDIPEGGSKGIIFVELFKLYDQEASKSMTSKEGFFNQYRSFCQISSQKRYILSLLDLINADESGKLRNHHIVDLYGKPEHLFLGPDENMTDPMIEWIAATSLKKHYLAKTAFISSKPKAGINHKTYGVTSYGVNTYMEEALKYLGIDPLTQPFTVKISGGPDGDVAGNQMLNLKKYYPKTAKLVAITDVSGTIYDPEGLDLNVLETLFHDAKPIRFYPHEKLHKGGYLLDLQTKKQATDLKELTLLVQNHTGTLEEKFLSGQEASQLFRQSLHQAKADIFIPAGGRPRTLNDYNVQEFLDKDLKPTSRAIVEGANLYLTPRARRFLEDKGVIIFKDSSANKGGVICSSYEVLGGLCLTDEQFMQVKEALVKDILSIIKDRAQKEARLLLKSKNEGLGFLTDLSDEISAKINTFKYELLSSLLHTPLSKDPHDPLNKIVLNYIPPEIRKEISDATILSSIADVHKKAIIAVHLASNVVYLKGLKWSPGISELLPLLLTDHDFNK